MMIVRAGEIAVIDSLKRAKPMFPSKFHSISFRFFLYRFYPLRFKRFFCSPFSPSFFTLQRVDL